MPVICTSASSRLTAFRPFLQMAQQADAPGTIKEPNKSYEILDFTDPARAILTSNNRTCLFLQISRGDPIHGYPNPETMTNFVFWNSIFICISDGRIWVTARETNRSWAVVTVPNTETNIPLVNSRNDFLYVEDDTLTLVQFLNDTDEEVRIHEFALVLQLNPPSDASDDTELIRLASSLSLSHHGDSITVRTQATQTSSDVTTASSFANHRDSHCLTSSRARNGDSLTADNETSNILSCKMCKSTDRSLIRSVILPCCHVACSECIERWFSRNSDCPFCWGEIENTFKLKE